MANEMTHEPFREMLCLRLYGELTAEERAAVERHLQSCADCRAFEAELAGTLAALQSPRGARIQELPSDWSARLSARIQSERRRSWTRLCPPFAAGLAAGLLLMAGLRPQPEQPGNATAPRMLSGIGGAPPYVPSAEPPPRSTSQGALAHLGSWLER
jgi:anti-sigma factor RsiW